MQPTSILRSPTFATCVTGLVLTLTSGCQTFSKQNVPNMAPTNAAMNGGTKEPDLPALDSAKLCFTAADTFEQGGQFGEAIKLYEKSRQEDSRLGVQATRRLAILHDRTGNFDKAIEEYQRGLHDNPRDAELFNGLGYGYYNRAEWELAEKNLRKAVTLDPKMTTAWNNLGMTLAMQLRYEEALTAFEKVVPKAQALCNLAFIQATQKKYAEARQNYERALELQPGLQLARSGLQKLGQINQSSQTANLAANALR
jgi:tetratricopeptide (TPR) repeat protein